MISDTEKLALVRASKDLNMTPLELIEATCQACMATFINSDVARVEREACAKVCDELGSDWYEKHHPFECARKIRSRGEA